MRGYDDEANAQGRCLLEAASHELSATVALEKVLLVCSEIKMVSQSQTRMYGIFDAVAEKLKSYVEKLLLYVVFLFYWCYPPIRSCILGFTGDCKHYLPFLDVHLPADHVILLKGV